ncbi:acyltransferase family protein, partial [Cellulomonas hominis]|uniref:acyltransferase family protein n=1 Tax=Cellulomonas hominis TaxID=156981 RepID=UPI001BCD9C19
TRTGTRGRRVGHCDRPSAAASDGYKRQLAVPVAAAVPAPAAVTPAAPRRSLRDPFVDGVRALGTILVVALHWLMVEATWDGQDLVVGNALSHGWAWLLTWLQPLPLLFFAAGAAARYDLVRHPGQPGWRFAGVRLLRMARPVGIFAAVWALLVVTLPALGVPEAAVERAARIVPQPLWFLGVQLGLLALTPLLLGLLRRFGAARVLVVAAALPVVVDLLRFSDEVAFPGVPNILLVWAIPFLGGLVYAERRTRTEPRPGARPGVPERTVLALLTGGGLAATVLLLMTGPYPVSLIGMPGDAMSNLAPPTAPVVGFAVAQVAAALLVRDAVARWAARSRVVAWVGGRSMGLYLWHLTAMFAVAGVVLLGVGETLPEPWTWDWWASRAGYLGAAGLVLAALAAGAARVERGTRVRRVRRAGDVAVPA